MSKWHRGISQSEWKRTREEILNDEPLCRECLKKGFTIEAKEVDHIIPLAMGGGHDKTNLQPLCKTCHKNKTARENSNKIEIGSDGWPKNDKLVKYVLVRRRNQRERIYKRYQ